MTKSKHSPRKTARSVRMPATKFPKIQKRLKSAKFPGKIEFRKPS